MKNIFSLIMLLTSLISFSQQGTELPNFTPPSPEAAAMTQYGNVEINESTGKAAVAVPIYSYKAGQINLPISLNYIGGGVKVNDVSTWTGINWTLNAGGVISRTVYDAPDEVAQERIFKEDTDALDLVPGYPQSDTNPSNNAEVLFQYYQNEPWDTQPDIFNFSFPGYSGSFYLDKNFVPVLLSDDTALMIEIEGTDSDDRHNLIHTKEFKITTPEGVKYYFGGNEVETSFMEYGWHTNTQANANTGFYLNRIVHPINGSIYFEYLNINNLPINYETHTNAIHSAQMYLTHAASGGTNFDNCVAEKKHAEGRIPNNAPSININFIRNAKFLSRVYSPNNSKEVIFNSTKTKNGGRNFERVLESIEVKNNNVQLKEIKLNYIFDNGIGNIYQRFFLEKVSYYNGSNIKENEYKFVYNNPTGLPDRFSYAQDHYGYYNGADNNTGLLPAADIPGLTNVPHQISSLSDNANRNFVFNKSLYGTLEKVIYPTKGSTVFDYEYTPKKKKTLNRIDLNTYRNDYPEPVGNLTYPNDLEEHAFFGMTGSQATSVPVIDADGNITTLSTSGLLEDQDVLLKTTFRATQAINNNAVRARVIVTNLTDNNTVELNSFVVMTSQNTMNANYHVAYREFPHHFLKNKEYKVELKLDEGTTSVPMHANLKLEYYNGLEVVNGGSLRVKRVTDKPSATEDANVKRYYYLGKEAMLKDPFLYIPYYKEPIYVKNTTFLYTTSCKAEQGLPPIDCGVIGHPGGVLESSPNNIPSDNNVNKYDVVTISYGGDNFELGGVEKRFNKDTSHVILVYKGSHYSTPELENLTTMHKDAPWLHLAHGKPKKETVLVRRLDTLYKVSEKELRYTNNTNKMLIANVGSFYRDCGVGFYAPYSNVGLGSYEIRSKEILLKQTIAKNYIDMQPITWDNNDNLPTPNPYIFKGWITQDHDNDLESNYNDQDYQDLIDNYDPFAYLDESNYRKIITTTDYEYNSSYSGQPTKIITTTNNNLKRYESVSRYLDESVLVSNANANILENYANVALQHRISSPIQTESYLNNDGDITLLSKNRTLYNTFQGKYLPSKIQSAKGTSTLEDRIEFVNYDYNGNPIEVKKTNGSLIKYTYNNLNQVTRKVDNYVGINPNPDTSGTDCEDRNSLYMEAQVTSFYYDNTTNLITHIIDTGCIPIYYEYDDQYRLKHVKDKDGNILSKNVYHYATQN